MTTPAPGWRHAPQLDALRAVAIAIVMASHAGLEKIAPGGFGVTIFFFLSGYLITSLLRIEASTAGRVDLKAFYLRRTVRIVPPFLLAILFTLSLQFAGLVPAEATPLGLVMDLAFLSNYSDLLGVPIAVRIPLWSLDVEEHFYIGFSVLYALFLARRAPRLGALWCAAACLVVLALRYAHAMGGDVSPVYFWSHTRMDSILFGCILALWHNPLLDDGAWRPGLKSLLFAGAILLLGYLHPDLVFRRTLSYTLQGIALFIVFSWLLHLDRRFDALFSRPPIKWLGLLSYTLYLVHLPLLQAVGSFGIPAPWLLGYCLAILYALASYLLIEMPLGLWRRRCERRRMTEPGMQAASS